MNPGARRRPPPGPGAALVVAPGGGRGEQAALADRLGLLLVVRCGIVAFVVVGAVAAPRQLGLTVGQAGPISAAYLVLGGAVEWFRRNGGRGRLHVFRAMLPLDSLYLVLVTAPTGGPRSELEFLFFVQLVATTLLASPRTGLRIALWDSFLFVLVGALSLGPEIARLLGAGAVDATDPTALAVAIMAFWAVAVCTAVSSSVSERELRRSKAELGVMAALAVELEAATTADEILPILLRRSVEVFGAGRGAVLWGNERQLQAWRAGVADRFVAGPGVVGPGVVGPGVAGPGVVGPGVAGPGVVDHVRIDEVGGGDLIVRQAGAGRAPVLARRLDPSADPVLSGLLPGARNVVVVPLPEEGDQSGALALERGGTWHQRVPRRTLAVLEQLCSHATLALRSARLFAEVGRMATMDGLTGLANRREFDRSLEREVLRVQRSGEPLSLVLIDVDHFKAVNDSLGHLAGDEVLRAVATVLAAEVRDSDLLARYGGEEFVILLPACQLADAWRVGERVRAAVASRVAPGGVTVSGGAATMPDHASSGRALLAAADAALYDAKAGGRNRMACSTGPEPAGARHQVGPAGQDRHAGAHHAGAD